VVLIQQITDRRTDVVRVQKHSEKLRNMYQNQNGDVMDLRI